jgi:hypothetical protein
MRETYAETADSGIAHVQWFVSAFYTINPFLLFAFHLPLFCRCRDPLRTLGKRKKIITPSWDTNVSEFAGDMAV